MVQTWSVKSGGFSPTFWIAWRITRSLGGRTYVLRGVMEASKSWTIRQEEIIGLDPELEVMEVLF